MSYNFGYILYYKYNPHKILRFIEPATKLSFLSGIIASTQFAIWHSSGQFDLACERVPKKISTTDPVFKMNRSRIIMYSGILEVQIRRLTEGQTQK